MGIFELALYVCVWLQRRSSSGFVQNYLIVCLKASVFLFLKEFLKFYKYKAKLSHLLIRGAQISTTRHQTTGAVSMELLDCECLVKIRKQGHVTYETTATWLHRTAPLRTSSATLQSTASRCLPPHASWTESLKWSEAQWSPAHTCLLWRRDKGKHSLLIWTSHLIKYTGASLFQKLECSVRVCKSFILKAGRSNVKV